jgi:hypothetical protein
LAFYVINLLSEASRKESRMTLNLEAMITEAPPKSKVSSANCEWFIFFTPQEFEDQEGFHSLFLAQVFLRASTTMMKSNGERGHP